MVEQQDGNSLLEETVEIVNKGFNKALWCIVGGVAIIVAAICFAAYKLFA